MKFLKTLILLCFTFALLAQSSIARDLTYLDGALNSAKLQGSGRLT
jgi:hypothetical protein